VQLLQTGTVYQSSIDNIRFQSPAVIDPVISPGDVWDSFEDRKSGAGESLLAPWSSYVYAENNNAISLNEGISSQGADGGQVTFVVFTNPPNPGAYSGFGLQYAFTNEWALPANTNEWVNYSLSYDFKENNGHSCVLEIQVKSSPTNWVQFTKNYSP